MTDTSLEHYGFKGSTIDDMFAEEERRRESNRSSKKVSEPSDSFWPVKSNSTTYLYFITDEWNDPCHSWLAWEEIRAVDGFVGGLSVPKNNPDMWHIPVHSDRGPEGDDLLALVNPYFEDDEAEKANRRTRPTRVFAGFNAVEVRLIEDDKGEKRRVLNHKILYMTPTRIKKMRAIIASYRKISDNFTLVGKAFRLTVKGDWRNEEVLLDPVNDSEPIELPQPWNIAELLEARRARVLDYVLSNSRDSLAQDGGAMEDVFPDLSAETFTDASDAVPSPSDMYASMTDSRLKNMLTKGGVSYSPQATRAELIALATAKL